MIYAEEIQESNQICYADAERLADLWNAAYGFMREIVSDYIEAKRHYLVSEGWKVDPDHPMADVLQAHAILEPRARKQLKDAEYLRRNLGQIDRAAHRPCTQSPPCFTITSAYLLTRNALALSSLNADGLDKVYRLIAELAEHSMRINENRRAARN
jgi:hypothetical protein